MCITFVGFPFLTSDGVGRKKTVGCELALHELCGQRRRIASVQGRRRKDSQRGEFRGEAMGSQTGEGCQCADAAAPAEEPVFIPQATGS